LWKFVPYLLFGKAANAGTADMGQPDAFALSSTFGAKGWIVAEFVTTAPKFWRVRVAKGRNALSPQAECRINTRILRNLTGQDTTMVCSVRQ